MIFLLDHDFATKHYDCSTIVMIILPNGFWLGFGVLTVTFKFEFEFERYSFLFLMHMTSLSNKIRIGLCEKHSGASFQNNGYNQTCFCMRYIDLIQ